MPEEEKTDNSDEAPPTGEPDSNSDAGSRYPEMDELQSEIDRRIRDNRKFLDHFMDTDFVDDEDEDDDEDDEIFEEL